ncbi:FAD-dependent monooxygenase [Polaromonas sp.]|uniref:FAD-dependent monooxygenase n=1 Tax=Polaromonas sp. TaxID=1869339 RepID=UPI003BAC5B27
MKIAVVGAGPAGLYFSILVARRFPDWQIDVIEQNAPDSTFGFGVVLADSGLNRLQAADAATYEQLVAKMTFTTHQIITQKDTPVAIRRPNKGGGAIARIDLLSVLQKAATEAGVNIRYRHRVDSPDQLDLGNADVVVGADGVNSAVRAADEQGFGTTKSFLTNHFAWFGVNKAFPTAALVFREYQGGAFIAHYYPYTSGHSTFVAECDHATWLKLGMEQLGADARQALFEKVFAKELDGHPLVSNNSAWRQFPVIRNAASVSGKTVLLGDAETSAHFSIGSGTRIAMDDAIALAEALTADGDDQAVAAVQRLERFAKTRGPEKAKLIDASQKSYLWYENIGEWMKCYSPLEFVHAFMMRTGRVNEERLAKSYPELFSQIQTERDAKRRVAA